MRAQLVIEHENMKIAFFIAFAANVLFALASLAVLPDQVAIHFGAGSAPDSWAAKETYALIMLAIDIPVFLILSYSPSLMLKCPASIINLPNKDYWLSQENRPSLRQKLGRLMNQFGTALFLFLFCVGLLVVHANLSQPVRLNERVFLSALAVFLAYTVFWCVGLYRSFRVPK